MCSITDALSIVGDRYALLVARELRYGRTRFQDIAAGTGAPRDVLTARLRKLELAGVIERRRYCEHPPGMKRPRCGSDIPGRTSNLQPVFRR